MAAWPGGPCPNCAEDMPARLVRCRALLNDDLQPAHIEIPEFQPLQELESFIELPPRGFYVSCPQCDRSSRSIESTTRSVRDSRIATLGFYFNCPYCHKRLRMSPMDVGMNVGCIHCRETIRLIDEEAGILNRK